MANENTQAAPTGKVCPGDCLQCTRVQQLYCASQGNLEIIKTLDSLAETVKNLTDSLQALTEKVDRLSESGSDKPTQVIKKGKAPKSSGADN